MEKTTKEQKHPLKEICQEIKLNGKILKLKTGKIARQAHSVIAEMGNTIVLCCVVINKTANAAADFLPLTVNYMERLYAAGRIPGGFFKREAKPSEREILISRLIDRSIRPLFPKGFFNEVTVTCTLLSYDPAHQPDIIAMIGAYAALAISGAPIAESISAARIGYVDGQYLLNPAASELTESKLDLIIAGTQDSVLMIESEVKELTEEEVLNAILFGQKSFEPVLDAIDKLKKEAGFKAFEFSSSFDNKEITEAVKSIASEKLKKAYKILNKQERVTALDAVKEEVVSNLIVEKGMDETQVLINFKDLKAEIVRSQILKDKQRIDGRSPQDIRDISIELDILPSTHGSALFTRGETQALVVTTLGFGDDEQLVDNIEGLNKVRFTLHYNFPQYSVGETGAPKPPGRREIGHGNLAFRAISPLLPAKDIFPYPIRVVSEITESNGSSSMATVCGGSLSLMTAGVPLELPIAGIAMGLIKEGEDFVVLSDILGDEDALGDMDFKVAGTERGITTLQMDIKITGMTESILRQALDQARQGRIHILGCMAEAIESSRTNVAKHAPQIVTLKIPKEKIGELIGPGGKMIKEIIEKTKVKIDIEDSGNVNIASTSLEGIEAALEIINEITSVPEVGKVYNGTVMRIVEFGAFVAVMRNQEGLLHVTEIPELKGGKHLTEVLSQGQKVDVKVVSIDRGGKIRLSMNLAEDAVHEERKPSSGDSRKRNFKRKSSGHSEESKSSNFEGGKRRRFV